MKQDTMNAVADAGIGAWSSIPRLLKVKIYV